MEKPRPRTTGQVNQRTLATLLPIILLPLTILALWRADLHTAYEAPYLLNLLNFVFMTAVSGYIFFLVARNFLASASPGLLLICAGVAFWASAGLSGTLAALANSQGGRFDPNTQIAIHNICAWLSSLCHLAGAALSLRWSGLRLQKPRHWLLGLGVALLGSVGFTLVSTLSQWTPVFFTAASGATPVRQLLLASAIAMLVVTALLLRQGCRPKLSTCIAWYSAALLLLALGLFSAMLEPAADSALSWLSRGTQYLGGIYMTIAAIAATREPGERSIDLGPVSIHAWYDYGVAALIVLAAAIVRLVFIQGLGGLNPFVTFYPAIALAALYAGFRAGLLAAVLSMALAAYFWIEPESPVGNMDTAHQLAMLIFFLSAVLISSIVECLHRALKRRYEAETEQKKLNRSLRLLSDCSMTLVRAKDEGQLLNELCYLVVASGGYLMAWVGIAEEDEAKSVRAVAQSGYEEGYLESVRISWDGAQAIGRGPTGTAIRTASTKVNQNCLTTPEMLPWREAALKRGYQSSVALPIIWNGKTLGALTIYSAEPEAFASDEVKLLEELANNMAYGLQSLRDHHELERYQQHLEELVRGRTQEIAELNSELMAKAKDADSANQAKSTFLATMSHEIRTPLNAVVGLAGLLADTPLNRRQRDYADKIKLSAQVLRALIDDILDFSKIEAGALQLEQAPFSLDAILSTTAQIVSVNKRDKPIEVLFEVAQDIPDELIGDALRLQQILMNLTGNAVKFTERGEIVVSVHCIAQEAGRVTLRFIVRDTGIGIRPEQLERIFEIFSQADASTCREYGGTGIGLAISARLINLMGGQISVHSTLGQGSEFHFTVPLALASGSALAAAEKYRPGLRLLIVDDHALSRSILLKTCSTFGWQAEAVDSASAALAELRRSAAEDRDYDLMLLDWQMPGMDGIEMLRQAQATPAIGLPLVVLMANPCELEQAIAASDDLYIDYLAAKPITPTTLFNAVKWAHSGEGSRLALPPGKLDQRLSEMQLLVAEDNVLNQQVIKEILSRAGAKVAIAANGLEAVTALQSGAHFDAVLMDINMPVMDGYTATRIIREELGRIDLPIIAVTASARPEDREKSWLAGMVGHLVKPIDVEALLDIVAEDCQEAGGAPKSRDPAASVSPVSAIRLPGWDVASALKTFGGDEEKFCDFLRQFVANHSGDAVQARRLLNDGDTQGTAQLIHSLLGVACLLQATDLANLAAATESALGGDSPQDLPFLLDELEAMLNILSAAIDKIETIRVGD
jgi:signal transduction histidine kinase/CheY-like chemotaxis protein